MQVGIQTAEGRGRQKPALPLASELMDKFLGFFHSLFVEGRTDQGLFRAQQQVSLDAALGQEQGKRRVSLNLFFEKLDCVQPGLIHRVPPA
jgi:hypothetical protein